MTRDRKRAPGGRVRFYGCAFHHKRGAKVCSNGTMIAQKTLDDILLEEIAKKLNASFLEDAVEAALRRLRAGQEQQLDRRTQITRELSLIEAAEKRVVDAIARGAGAVDPFLARLRAEEDRKRALTAEFEDLGKAAKVITLGQAADMRRELREDVPGARRLIRRLVKRGFVAEPVAVDGKRGYRLKGDGSYLELLPAAVTCNEMVTPAGPDRFRLTVPLRVVYRRAA